MQPICRCPRHGLSRVASTRGYSASGLHGSGQLTHENNTLLEMRKLAANMKVHSRGHHHGITSSLLGSSTRVKSSLELSGRQELDAGLELSGLYYRPGIIGHARLHNTSVSLPCPLCCVSELQGRCELERAIRLQHTSARLLQPLDRNRPAPRLARSRPTLQSVAGLAIAQSKRDMFLAPAIGSLEPGLTKIRIRSGHLHRKRGQRPVPRGHVVFPCISMYECGAFEGSSSNRRLQCRLPTCIDWSLLGFGSRLCLATYTVGWSGLKSLVPLTRERTFGCSPLGKTAACGHAPLCPYFRRLGCRFAIRSVGRLACSISEVAGGD